MRLLILIFISVFISSCLKLDSNLYNNDNTLKEYQLDNYTGTQDFILDASAWFIAYFFCQSLYPKNYDKANPASFPEGSIKPYNKFSTVK